MFKEVDLKEKIMKFSLDKRSYGFLCPICKSHFKISFRADISMQGVKYAIIRDHQEKSTKKKSNSIYSDAEVYFYDMFKNPLCEKCGEPFEYIDPFLYDAIVLFGCDYIKGVVKGLDTVYCCQGHLQESDGLAEVQALYKNVKIGTDIDVITGEVSKRVNSSYIVFYKDEESNKILKEIISSIGPSVLSTNKKMVRHLERFKISLFENTSRYDGGDDKGQYSELNVSYIIDKLSDEEIQNLITDSNLIIYEIATRYRNKVFIKGGFTHG